MSLEAFGKIIGGLLVWSIVAVIFFYMGMNWHVSDPKVGAKLFDMPVVSDIRQHGPPMFHDFPRVTVKDRLTAVDAVFNAMSMFVSGLIFVPVLIFGPIIVLVFGFGTGDWGTFLWGALLVVLSPFAMSLGLIAYYLLLLLQPCTPGYAVLWLLLGLPALAAGAGSNILAFNGVNVLIFRK